MRGTNATLKPKHTRLAAEKSTLHASMCTVARKESGLQKLTSIGSAQVVDVTKEACDRGREGDNGVRGTNATRKRKHTRLAAEMSTLHASMCTVSSIKA